MRELLHLDRLGLDHTYWEILEPTPPGTPPRAHQYYATAFDNIVLDASHDLYGGGGLVSTVDDLARFYRGLFHGKVFDKAATLKTMTKVSGPGRDAGRRWASSWSMQPVSAATATRATGERRPSTARGSTSRSPAPSTRPTTRSFDYDALEKVIVKAAQARAKH